MLLGFVPQPALQECDEADGVHGSTQPDRKTIVRVVERAEATGRIQVGSGTHSMAAPSFSFNDVQL